MLKVANKKTIWNLAIKCFRQSKTRNIMAVASIILTSILFTTVFTLATGMTTALQKNSMRLAGGDGMVALKYITQEQYDKIKTHPLIKEISYNRVIADEVVNQEFIKRRVEIYYMDEVARKLSFIELEKGNIPMEEDEICMDSTSLKLLDIPLEIGQKISLDLNIGEEIVTRDFTLSGYWDSYEMVSTGFALVSEAYMQAHQAELENTFKENYKHTGVINSYVMFENSNKLEEKQERIITESGFSMEETDDNFIEHNVNWAYLSSSIEKDPLSAIGVIACVLLIMLTGYLIIYNIFQISVIREIRFYGLLKTIGTTGNQIKNLVHMQTLTLSMIGIPIGLLFGYIIGRGLLPFLTSGTSITKADMVMNIQPGIFIGGAIFTLITVFISCRKPAKIAALVSPVEAVSYVGSYKRKKKNSTDGGKLYRMALTNITKNKRRLVMILLSMSLSIVLLNCTYSIVTSFDMDEFLNMFVDSDFLLGNADYFNAKYFSEDDVISDTFMEAVSQRPEFEEGGKIYCHTNMYVKSFWKELRKQLVDLGGQISESYVDDNGEFYNCDLDGNPLVLLYGLEDLPLSKINIIEGETQIDKLKELLDTGDYVMLALATDDYGKPHEERDYIDIGEKITFLLKDGTQKECEVIAKMAIDHYTSSTRYYMTSLSVYTSAQGYQQIAKNDWVMSYAVEAKEGQEASLDRFLKNYTEQEEILMNYESKTSYVKQFEEFQFMFLLIGGGLAGIIGIIGLLNFMNVIITSIVTREKEFAMLRAIGMTSEQLTRLICMEGIYYVIGTILLSMSLSLLTSVTIVKMLTELFWFTSYQFTLKPALIAIPVILVLGVFIPFITEKFFKKDSIVESIRKND